VNLKHQTLVLATHNKGKIKELSHKLAPFDVAVLSLSDYGIEAPGETGTTFAENAQLKAHHAALKTKRWALADDSGLKVHALNGRPGVYSARWAGPNQDYKKAFDQIYLELQEAQTTDWLASFECVLALCSPQGALTLFRGEVQGTLVYPPRGIQNFGYDPIFQPLGYTKTFGEMSFEEKQAFATHRQKALDQFLKACF